MKRHTGPDHLPAFISRMRAENLPDLVIDTFAYYYRQVRSGEQGLITDDEISPVALHEVENAEGLSGFAAHGRQIRSKALMIKLNGGLGTSMGLTGPKSLVRVKEGKSFLAIILDQADATGVRLAFMNSFSTHRETVAAVERKSPATEPLFFLQHKFPKILREDLTPASWPENPEMEWNPPGHGDIYTALHTSGMLAQLLDRGITYAFISNSDNLGAVFDDVLLGYFAERGLPFMMEVARRTPADLKGGHLARSRNGRLLLREIAQCPEDEIEAFQNIDRYRFFNTNSLWVNLEQLNGLIRDRHVIPLPLILNPKSLDPRKPESPQVYQIETAMGAAVSLFEGATAVQVPDDRFFPVKKCTDLLAVRSDCYRLSEDHRLMAHPRRSLGRIRIGLDPVFYGTIDRFEKRFAAGIPSLVGCESLTIRGDVVFEENVTIAGNVTISNGTDTAVVISKGTVVDHDLSF